MAGAWHVLEEGGQPPDPLPAATPPEGAAWLRWPILLGIAGALALAVAAWLLVGSSAGGDLDLGGARHVALGAGSAAPGDPSGPPPTSGEPSERQVVVEVNGAVRRPGVYRVAAGARVADAIAAAGGFSPRVDAVSASTINLAARVADGQQIHVPARDERPGVGAGGSGTGK